MMQKQIHWSYHLATVALLVGIVLTAVSALHLCSGMCNEAHNYRLFGMPFEVGGAFYFLALTVVHFLAKSNASWRRFMGVLIAGGLGAELFFIFVQKFEIGSWCPVCLSIAASISLLGIAYLILGLKQQEDYMRGWSYKAILMSVLVLGFGSSFFGVTKIDQLQAVENAIKEKIKFGNTSSPVAVYIFTDWACPACRAIEPTLEAMAPAIMQVAQLTFIDAVVHPETLNFAPYNLSFMVNAKPQYFKIREALGRLSVSTKKPTDEDVQKAVASLGVKYQELPYADVSTAMSWSDDLVTKFKVTGTPTIAIVNAQAKKGKKLEGAGEITQENVLKAIESLK